MSNIKEYQDGIKLDEGLMNFKNIISPKIDLFSIAWMGVSICLFTLSKFIKNNLDSDINMTVVIMLLLFSVSIVIKALKDFYDLCWVIDDYICEFDKDMEILKEKKSKEEVEKIEENIRDTIVDPVYDNFLIYIKCFIWDHYLWTISFIGLVLVFYYFPDNINQVLSFVTRDIFIIRHGYLIFFDYPVILLVIVLLTYYIPSLVKLDKYKIFTHIIDKTFMIFSPVVIVMFVLGLVGYPLMVGRILNGILHYIQNNNLEVLLDLGSNVINITLFFVVPLVIMNILKIQVDKKILTKLKEIALLFN